MDCKRKFPPASELKGCILASKAEATHDRIRSPALLYVHDIGVSTLVCERIWPPPNNDPCHVELSYRAVRKAFDVRCLL